MKNYEEFLASLTEDKFKEIIEGPVNQDQKYFFEGYAPSSKDMFLPGKEKQLETYVNITSVNAVIRLLRAYDEFLSNNE